MDQRSFLQMEHQSKAVIKEMSTSHSLDNGAPGKILVPDGYILCFYSLLLGFAGT